MEVGLTEERVEKKQGKKEEQTEERGRHGWLLVGQVVALKGTK